MVLYLIGLGLGDEDDITVKGLKIIQNADKLFLEAYTSILYWKDGKVDTERLEHAYGLKDDDEDNDNKKKRRKRIVVADREMIENHIEEEILEPARHNTVALLVVGDPVCATTHTDILLRCHDLNIKYEIIHNTSIMGAAGASGLQLYQFGQTISIPFFTDEWRPTSFYSKILYNRRGQLHTLCLLDIKVKEPDYNALIKGGKKQDLPPRFMTISQAALQLIETEEILKQNDQHESSAYDPNTTLCIGLARMGKQHDQLIVAGTLQELSTMDCGGPLHSLIISGGKLHDLEWDFVKQFLVEGSTACPNEQEQPEVSANEGAS